MSRPSSFLASRCLASGVQRRLHFANFRQDAYLAAKRRQLASPTELDLGYFRTLAVLIVFFGLVFWLAHSPDSCSLRASQEGSRLCDYWVTLSHRVRSKDRATCSYSKKTPSVISHALAVDSRLCIAPPSSQN
jgi:hypothetical protein